MTGLHSEQLRTESRAFSEHPQTAFTGINKNRMRLAKRHQSGEKGNGSTFISLGSHNPADLFDWLLVLHVLFVVAVHAVCDVCSVFCLCLLLAAFELIHCREFSRANER